MSLLLLVPVGAGARWDPVRRAVSTGVVVGHRAVPCWPFPNQRGGKHASLARPVTKMPARSNQKWANWPKWVRKYGGASSSRTGGTCGWSLPPSFKPKRISSLLCRPGPTLGTPRFGPRPWSLQGVLARADRFQISPRVHVSPTFLRIACSPVIWHGNNSTEQTLPGKPARLARLVTLRD